MNNEEKMYNLLEKIYVEFNDKFEGINKELHDTKKELKEDIKKVETKIENEISNKVRSLYDNREITNDKLDNIDKKLDKMQIDINSLTIKTTYNDSRMIELAKQSKNIASK